MSRATRIGLLAQKVVVPAARVSRSTWVTPRAQPIGPPGTTAGAALPTWGSLGGFSGAWGLGARRSPRFEQVRYHGDDHGHSHGEVFDTPKVGVKFVYQKDGSVVPATGRVGMNVLRVAQGNNIDLEGACECSLACSTCHVILEQKLYDDLDEAEITGAYPTSWGQTLGPRPVHFCTRGSNSRHHTTARGYQLLIKVASSKENRRCRFAGRVSQPRRFWARELSEQVA